MFNFLIYLYVMCSTSTPAGFILRKIKEGLPYDESIKRLLIMALDEQTFELNMSSEAILFTLPDAKELLFHYLDGRHKTLWLTFNGENLLIGTAEYEDLLFSYIEKRALDEDVQKLMFTHKNAQKLVKFHFEKQGLSPKIKHQAEKLGWL